MWIDDVGGNTQTQPIIPLLKTSSLLYESTDYYGVSLRARERLSIRKKE